MLDLDLIRTFVAVVDAGGFTRAAERVNRTQSTVSQQIRRLEEVLGRTLLERDRTAGSVVLTHEGEILLAYARRLVDLSVEAREAVLHPLASSIVRLGVTEDFAGRKLTDLLRGFARQCPGVRLDTTSAWSGELRRQLDKRELDLALVKRDAGDGPCLARWPERLAWVAGADAAEWRSDPLPLALFPQGCIYRRRAVDAVEALGRRWRVAFVGQGLAAVQAAIASSLGVGLLAGDAIQRDHRELGPNEGFPELPRTELALLAGSVRPTRVVSRLRDYLVEHVGRQGAA